MVIIVDCGSTKADWLILHGGRNQQLENTVGFNPFFQTSDDIRAIISEQLLEKIEDAAAVREIYFYGTGIHDNQRAMIVKSAFNDCFPSATIEIHHDLLAAARATCGRAPGICCILGTGSNSCYYDGEKIIDNVPSLGWLLGDEGSGTHLGKALLRSFFYRELPVDLEAAFKAEYPENPSTIKDKIYEEGANVYLASFTRFMGERQNHPFIYPMIKACLSTFLDRHVLKYKGHKQVPIHFVGSIAFHFEKVLTECLEERNMKKGTIIRKPIFSLADYHLNGQHAYE